MKTRFLILAGTCLLSLSACTPTLAVHGNMLEDYQMKEILPGIDTREDVVRKIGSPTTVAPFNDNTWYYMGQKTEKRGVLDPKVTNERIVVVSFAADGMVDKVIERRDGRKDIPIVQRSTPATGNEFTLMQQMLGNIGKFNSGASKSAATTGNGGLDR